jgi:hypothetical protein
MDSVKQDSPNQQEILNHYDEYINDVKATVNLLLDAIEIGNIPHAEEFLPKSKKKNGQVKRPSNSNILCSNQLMKFGVKKIAENICGKYKYNKQRIMVISRRFTGKIWKEMIPDETKKYFETLAYKVDKLHKDKYPDYKLVKTKKVNKKLTIKHYESSRINKPGRGKKSPVKNKAVTSPPSPSEDEDYFPLDHMSLEHESHILPEYFSQPQPIIPKINQQIDLLTPFIYSRSNNQSSIQSVTPRHNVQISIPPNNQNALISQFHLSNEMNFPTFDVSPLSPLPSCGDHFQNFGKFNNQILSSSETFDYEEYCSI